MRDDPRVVHQHHSQDVERSLTRVWFEVVGELVWSAVTVRELMS